MTLSKNTLNKIASHPLQTWEWGGFRQAWGNKVVRLPFGQIIFSKVPHTKLTIGTFIKGPKPNRKQIEELKRTGKKEKAIFIKLEPNILSNEQDLELLKKHCFVGKTLFTPSSFWIDLTRSEEELLKNFTSKTRYNIRLARKHGVEIKEDNSDKTFAKYLELTFATAKRQNFYAHSEKYHRLMWQYLRPANIARLLVAKYQGKIITTWILFVWKDCLYYPYGASSDQHKEVMANNLMMWEAICLGKQLGLKTFDLWGREPGRGFTRFKEGYNPKVVEFLGSWDLVINKPLYYFYRIVEAARWFFLKKLR